MLRALHTRATETGTYDSFVFVLPKGNSSINRKRCPVYTRLTLQTRVARASRVVINDAIRRFGERRNTGATRARRNRLFFCLTLISSPGRRFHEHAYARVSTRIIRVASAAVKWDNIIISAVVVRSLVCPSARQDEAPRSWRAIKRRSRSSRRATRFRLASGLLREEIDFEIQARVGSGGTEVRSKSPSI